MKKRVVSGESTHPSRNSAAGTPNSVGPGNHREGCIFWAQKREVATQFPPCIQILFPMATQGKPCKHHGFLERLGVSKGRQREKC